VTWSLPSLGGVHIFVDQAVEDRFSADLLCADVGYGRVVGVGFVCGDVLGDAWRGRAAL
jgi:hypothetical protein